MFCVVKIFVLTFMVTFSTGYSIDHHSCMMYADVGDGPRSVEIEKAGDDLKMKVDFFANQVGHDAPLKIKHIKQGNFYATTSLSLIDVIYPVTNLDVVQEYKLFTITIPVPKVEINSDSLQFSLHRPGIEKDNVIWCFSTPIKVLHGMKEAPMPTPPPPPNA